MKIYIIIFLLIFGTRTGITQDDRLSEEDIQLEHQFIDVYKSILKRNYSESIEMLRALHKEDRSNDGILYELAKTYELDKNYQDSETYIKKAIELSPSNFWYYDFHAALLDKMDKPMDAIVPLQKMRSLEPENFDLAEKLAFNYLQTGNLSSAIGIYDELETKWGVQENFSRKKFDLYQSMNDHKSAALELEKLSNKYPDNPRYLNNLASAYIKAKDYKKAKKTYERILKIDPSNPTATMALSGSLAKKGNESAYLASLRTIITSKEVSIDQKIKELIPFVEKIDDKSNSVLQDELKLVIEDLQNTHYDDAKAFAIYGDYYMNIGDTKNASEKYKQTLEINQSIFPVWEQLFYALEANMDYPGLITYTNDALDLYPNQSVVYYFNGLGLNKTEEYQASNSILEEAILLSRKNKEIQYLSLVTTANNYTKLQQVDRAKKNLKKAETLFENQHPFFDETEKLLNSGLSEQERFMRGIKN